MSKAPSEGKSGLRRLSVTAWAMLTAVVALAGSLVSVGFTLVPSLKPDPREQIGAALSIFAVEPRVRIDDWARRAYGDRARAVLADIAGERAPPPDFLKNLGSVVYVRTQVDGYKHRAVTLQTSVYDSDGCRSSRGFCRLDYERVAAVPQPPPLDIESPDRSSVQLLFIRGIQDVQQPRDTFVRVELVDGEGILAVADTPVLRFGVPLRRQP